MARVVAVRHSKWRTLGSVRARARVTSRAESRVRSRVTSHAVPRERAPSRSVSASRRSDGPVAAACGCRAAPHGCSPSGWKLHWCWSGWSCAPWSPPISTSSKVFPLNANVIPCEFLIKTIYVSWRRNSFRSYALFSASSYKNIIQRNCSIYNTIIYIGFKCGFSFEIAARFILMSNTLVTLPCKPGYNFKKWI